MRKGKVKNSQPSNLKKKRKNINRTLYENHYDALTFFNCMLILHIAVIESGTKIVIPPTYVQNIRPIKITDTVNLCLH